MAQATPAPAPTDNLHLALAQLDLAWEDPAANLARLDELLDGQDLSQTHLLVLPEMFATGFTMQPAQLAEPATGGPAQTWMRNRAKRHGCWVVGSLAMAVEGGFVNRLLAVPPNGGAAQVYDKRHRFAMAGEHQVYQAGRTPLLTLQVAGWRIRPIVCYDLRFPVWCRNQAQDPTTPDRAAYDVLLAVANWPARRSSHWRALLAARAIENLAYAVGVNRTGTDGNGVDHDGSTAAYSPTAETLLQAPPAQALHHLVLPWQQLATWRQRFPALLDADPFAFLEPAQGPLGPPMP